MIHLEKCLCRHLGRYWSPAHHSLEQSWCRFHEKIIHYGSKDLRSHCPDLFLKQPCCQSTFPILEDMPATSAPPGGSCSRFVPYFCKSLQCGRTPGTTGTAAAQGRGICVAGSQWPQWWPGFDAHQGFWTILVTGRLDLSPLAMTGGVGPMFVWWCTPLVWGSVMGGMSNTRWKGSLGLTWGRDLGSFVATLSLGMVRRSFRKSRSPKRMLGVGLGVMVGGFLRLRHGMFVWSGLFVAAFVRWTPSGSIYPSFTDPSCKWNVGPLSMNSTFRSSHNTLRPAFRTWTWTCFLGALD